VKEIVGRLLPGWAVGSGTAGACNDKGYAGGGSEGFEFLDEDNPEDCDRFPGSTPPLLSVRFSLNLPSGSCK
jgi:hypothetical protein